MKSLKIKSICNWFMSKVVRIDTDKKIKLLLKGMIISVIIPIIGMLLGSMTLYIIGWCIFGSFFLSIGWLSLND